jgi:hypothetical protein
LEFFIQSNLIGILELGGMKLHRSYKGGYGNNGRSFVGSAKKWWKNRFSSRSTATTKLLDSLRKPEGSRDDSINQW